MIRAIFKVIGIAISLILLPLLVLGLSIAGLIAPIVGMLMIIFMPVILIGVLIGYRSGKKKRGEA